MDSNKAVAGEFGVCERGHLLEGPGRVLFWFVLKGLPVHGQVDFTGKQSEISTRCRHPIRFWDPLWNGDCWFHRKGMVRLKFCAEEQGE